MKQALHFVSAGEVIQLQIPELFYKLLGVKEHKPNTSPNDPEQSAGASGAEDNTASQETVSVGGKEYPKWAVEKAKRLLKRAGHDDLEGMLQSVLIVRDRLENAVPADPDEPGYAVPTGVVLLPKSFFVADQRE